MLLCYALTILSYFPLTSTNSFRLLCEKQRSCKNCFKNEWTFTNRIKPLHLFKLFRPWISEALDRVCKMEFYAVWYISLRTILVDRNPLKFHDQFYTWWLLRLHFAEEGPNSLCVFIVQLSATGKFFITTTETSQNSSKWSQLTTDHNECIDLCIRPL